MKSPRESDMPQHILVATDGSEHAGRAVDQAGELAAKLGAKLTILHVLLHGQSAERLGRMADSEHLARKSAQSVGDDMPPLPGQLTKVFHTFMTPERSAGFLHEIGQMVLDRAARRARDAGAADVATRQEDGDRADTIIRVAREIGADMIVLGRRGLGPVKRMVLGSVSQKVNAEAACTVVTVR
jgi:nucleotide-binding universal stress UspA family protein